MDEYARKTALSKKKNNKNGEKEFINQCSCNSLSEYLKFDITKMTSLKSKKEAFNREMIKNKNEFTKIESNNQYNSKNMSRNSKIIPKQVENQVKEANAIHTNFNDKRVSRKSLNTVLDTEKDEKDCQVQAEELEKDSRNKNNLVTDTEDNVKKSLSLNENSELNIIP
jgi:hypothetical protein